MRHQQEAHGLSSEAAASSQRTAHQAACEHLPAQPVGSSFRAFHLTVPSGSPGCTEADCKALEVKEGEPAALVPSMEMIRGTLSCYFSRHLTCLLLVLFLTVFQLGHLYLLLSSFPWRSTLKSSAPSLPSPKPLHPRTHTLRDILLPSESDKPVSTHLRHTEVCSSSQCLLHAIDYASS